MYESDDYEAVEVQFNAAVSATFPSPNVEKVAFVSFNGAWLLRSNETC